MRYNAPGKLSSKRPGKSVGGFVLGDDFRRDAAATAHIEPLLSGPDADSAGVLAGGLGAGRARGSAAGHAPTRVDEGLQALLELREVLLAEVNLIRLTVEAEGDRLGTL